jgi:hypothetical protein
MGLEEEEQYVPAWGEKPVYSNTCLGPYTGEDVGMKFHVRIEVPDPKTPNIKRLLYCNGLNGRVCENCSSNYAHTHDAGVRKECLHLNGYEPRTIEKKTGLLRGLYEKIKTSRLFRRFRSSLT